MQTPISGDNKKQKKCIVVHQADIARNQNTKTYTCTTAYCHREILGIYHDEISYVPPLPNAVTPSPAGSQAGGGGGVAKR